MITMTEIANKAGVSQATVSRVLNGSTAVSPETKALVMEWVRKLDFEPNQSARALASNRTHLIGLVLPDMLNPYFIDIIYHVEKIAALNGFNILFCNSDGSTTRELEIFKSLKSRQVEGLLIGFAKPDSQMVEEVKNSNIQTVVITQDSEGLDSVSVNHKVGGEISARHLINSGCKRFIYIGEYFDDKYYGFVDELGNQGFSEDYIDVIDMGHSWAHSSRKAYNKALSYIESNDSKEKIGVFATNDYDALGFVNAAQDLNKSVPDKYSVIGFDDTYLCQAIRPSITSVSQPKEDIGRLAINMLLNKIAKKDSGSTKVEKIFLVPSLVKRDSA